MKLFQYAVILHPKKDKEGNQTEKDKLIVDLTTVLAADIQSATLLAARAIPEDMVPRLEEIEVAVRPF